MTSDRLLLLVLKVQQLFQRIQAPAAYYELFCFAPIRAYSCNLSLLILDALLPAKQCLKYLTSKGRFDTQHFVLRLVNTCHSQI
jgi:hypothetical protein